MQGAKVYRGTTRIVVLTLAFLVAAAFFAGVAVIAKDSKGLAIGSWVVAALCLIFALRFPFMKAVATPEGLKLHGPIGNATFAWSDIASISGGETGTDGALIPVRAPVLTLTSGKKVEVMPASTYGKSSAGQIAAELESMRRGYTG